MEFRGPKNLVRTCPKCGSGDIEWEQISVRPHCRDCNYWPRPHHGTEKEMVKEWNRMVIEAHTTEEGKNDLSQWIPGIPSAPESDRLYAVMSKPEHGYAVAIVIRGADCNWKSIGIIAHYPLPLTMPQATALKLIRTGRYDFPEES